jgi:hypothetical protein
VKETKQEKGGAVLLSALAVLLAAFAFLGSFMSLNALRAGSIKQKAVNQRAYYAAKAGAEAAAHFIRGRGGRGREIKTGEISLSGNGAERAPSGEKAYVFFHERGEGFFSGDIFKGARCEAEWRRVDAGDAYIIESTGVISAKGGKSYRKKVYAYIQEHDGNFYITRWFE